MPILESHTQKFWTIKREVAPNLVRLTNSTILFETNRQNDFYGFWSEVIYYRKTCQKNEKRCTGYDVSLF